MRRSSIRTDVSTRTIYDSDFDLIRKVIDFDVFEI